MVDTELINDDDGLSLYYSWSATGIPFFWDNISQSMSGPTVQRQIYG